MRKFKVGDTVQVKYGKTPVYCTSLKKRLPYSEAKKLGHKSRLSGKITEVMTDKGYNDNYWAKVNGIAYFFTDLDLVKGR